jgi:hypothetical protein
MPDDFNRDGWLLDFADTSRSLHLLCEQWLYYHGSEHDEGGGCEMCAGVEEILQSLRNARTIKWEGVFDRRFLCPRCGVIPHWDARQKERDEVCLYVCCRCGGVVEENIPASEDKPRCRKCGWPLYENVKDGCAAASCSERSR